MPEISEGHFLLLVIATASSFQNQVSLSARVSFDHVFLTIFKQHFEGYFGVKDKGMFIWKGHILVYGRNSKAPEMWHCFTLSSRLTVFQMSQRIPPRLYPYVMALSIWFSLFPKVYYLEILFRGSSPISGNSSFDF